MKKKPRIASIGFALGFALINFNVSAGESVISGERADGKPFEVTAAGMSQAVREPNATVLASGGLDYTWNPGCGFDCIWLSYVGTDGAVHVTGEFLGTWNDDSVASFDGFDVLTRLSAYSGTVIVAFQNIGNNGCEITYEISYDGGGSWGMGTIVSPGPGEGQYFDFDIGAEGGAGTAAAFSHEIGEPDELSFQFRGGYQPGAWDDPMVINDVDVWTGGGMTMEWLDELEYGIVFVGGNDAPYFDRIGQWPIFFDGFESAGTTAWSSGKVDAETMSGGRTSRSADAGRDSNRRRPPSEVLAAIPRYERGDAVLEVESGNSIPAAEARRIEGLWNGGDYGTAINTLYRLEAEGKEVGVGIAWRFPEAKVGADHRIGGSRTGVDTVTLGYDAASGNLFAVVMWDDGTWTLNGSTDAGTTWTELYFWATATHASMTVVGGYVYVGYVWGSESVRLRRFDAATGASDDVYSFFVMMDTVPWQVEEIVLGNNREFDSRIYYALILSNGSLRFYWDDPTGGRMFRGACPDTTDTDGDGLPDCSETNTGVFIDSANTGTDPNDPDTDGDGISDGDEVLGTSGGLDLRTLGANPLRKTFLLEYDWFDDSIGGAHSHKPTQTTMNLLEAAFAAAPVINPDGSTGIDLIQDVGQGGVYDGGELLSDADGLLNGGVNDADFQAHKHMAANRDGYFHYVMFVHQYNCTGGTDCSSSSGQAELPGDDLIIASYWWYNELDDVAKTIMHEFGHNLGLRHGGFESCNYKPNYNSIMNYRFQFPGIDDTCDPEGDEVIDYSIGDRIDLDENNLSEPQGTCGSPGWDWNDDGDSVDTGLVYDINSEYDYQADGCGGTYTVLRDYDDWANISFAGLSDGDAPFREIISCQPHP